MASPWNFEGIDSELKAKNIIGKTIYANTKADDEIKDIPIIALTAHALEADKERALAAGADDFDTKPVNLSGLLEKIEALLLD